MPPCARPAFPSPDLAALASTAFLEPRWCPSACLSLPDTLLCRELPLPPHTMRTSVLGHRPQDVTAWCPGACMCLRGEHRGLLLVILEMQSKHLLSRALSYNLLEVQLSLAGQVGERKLRPTLELEGKRGTSSLWDFVSPSAQWGF